MKSITTFGKTTFILPNTSKSSLPMSYKHFRCFKTDSIAFFRKQIQRELCWVRASFLAVVWVRHATLPPPRYRQSSEKRNKLFCTQYKTTSNKVVVWIFQAKWRDTNIILFNIHYLMKIIYRDPRAAYMIRGPRATFAEQLQGPLSTVTFFQITRRICCVESCHFTVITRNIKTIFRENSSSWSPDSIELFKIKSLCRFTRTQG